MSCTSELLAGSRASHWDRRPIAEGSSAHPWIPSIMSYLYTIGSIGASGSRTVSVTTASFAVDLAGILAPAPLPSWNTRVLDDNLHMFSDRGKTESCLVNASASHTDESVQVLSELKCTSVQEDTTGNVRVNICSCGNRSTPMSVVCPQTNGQSSRSRARHCRWRPWVTNPFCGRLDEWSIKVLITQ